ncbi:MAG: carboxypeptidase-like regulatory domain-containing protein, partial [Saprospiraceae bacterium]|nr:carboxypeptidase-like regulatory domain-containing protein [Saprospiraceae bacterium]
MRAFLLLLCVVGSASAAAQTLLHSRQGSTSAYIFQISNAQAEAVCRADVWQADSTFFHTLRDSFPADSSLQRVLPAGHYLITRIVKNQLKIDLLSVQPFDVAVLNNSADLNIAVHSTAGQALSDAVVHIDGRRIPFDRPTQTYRLRKSNQRGFLRVEHQVMTTFYKLDRQRNNPWTKRLVNNTPLRYVYRPVAFVLRTPVDALMSLSRRHGYRTHRIRSLFLNVGRGIACIFDPSECEHDRWQGYMVFNKPKFMPGDTVRLKAFVINRKGRPLNDSVSVTMFPEWNRPVNLGRIAPYMPGSYDFEFALHDSMKLQLDRQLRVELQKKTRLSYVGSGFRYEDYELKSLQFNLRADGEYQFRGKPYRLHLKGTDENELVLPDARVELLLTTVQVFNFHDSVVFVPDTLWRWEQALEPAGETSIEIPDSIFPLCDVMYRVEAVLLAADNERVSKTQNVTFFHIHKDIHFELKKDSLRMEYREEGQSKPAPATLVLLDALGQTLEQRLVQLPHTEAVNPYVSEYRLQAALLKKDWKPTSEQPMLQCFATRSSDSLFIACDNPRRIPFRYFLYRHNREIKRGYGTDWQLSMPAGERETYFIALQYLWGGQVCTGNYSVGFDRRQLNVQVEQPPMAWPGMETDIIVTVTDQRGRPVPNADLTAWAVTQKFQPQAPVLPSFEKMPRQRRLINTFNALRYQPQNTRTPLDFEYWRSKTGLDTAEYYRFAYPGRKLYRFEYKAPDSIAQFAPFFVLDGAPQPVHVVYVDQKPVYFGWNTNRQPYSIRISPGYHRVELRCTDRLIRLDSVLISPGKKLILSLSDSIQDRRVKSVPMPVSLTQDEENNLYRYIFPFRYKDNAWDYIEQKGEIQLLQPASGTYGMQLTGPILPDLFQYRNLQDNHTMDFAHEPMMEYDFAPGLLKMRSVKPESDYPDKLSGAAREELKDAVLTAEGIRDQRVKFLHSLRRTQDRFSEAKQPAKGNARLHWSVREDVATDERPLNTLLFHIEDPGFVKVAPGWVQQFAQLAPGHYRLVALFHKGAYALVDSILVRAGGTNFYEVERWKLLVPDTFSTRCHDILDQISQMPSLPQQELRMISNAYNQAFSYTGPGRFIQGRILDESGEPLIGATVMIEGGGGGTVTDFDGWYNIVLPEGKKLIVLYTGFTSMEFAPGANSSGDLVLFSSNEQLQEVVVVGYSAGHVKQDAISGSMIRGLPTRNLNALSGTVAGIQIRGSRSDDTEYYIDGVRVSSELLGLSSDQIQNIEVISDSAALAVFGPGAAEVVLITTKAGAKGMAFDAAFLEGAAEASSIRSRFSDYAFWQPRLRTNAEGKATFRVSFPDDITQWRTFVPAMTSRRQSGVGEARTRSFKPVAARLSLPRFLVAGDSALAIGRALNYGADTIDVEAAFEINGAPASTGRYRVADAVIDSVWLSPANTDSLTVQFSIRKSDGYFDGEWRSIPVFPQGIERSEGQFFVLEGDTSIVIQLPEKQGPVQLYARA